MEQVNISGITYLVVRKTFSEASSTNSVLLRRPKGKTLYMATEYNNGTFAKDVVSCRGIQQYK